ncbi:hypothetical protein GCM10007301_12310 [Azorhizobium oxalatiphilum]|uniref:Uncharacterized protein n=1 Tax=Azorhizobium oxalatiphilum TaxID=980631 RepID=A0A917BPN2_9HYPH|nr:hypothetical protein [Azorhizobium oxalatiphilum]GGF54338.1 hypothetical protein GCM10007301_12310 [Azorhizobium oxalatiphilum]
MTHNWLTPLTRSFSIRGARPLRLDTLADATRFLGQLSRRSRNDRVDVAIGMLSVAAIMGDRECVRVATEQLETLLRAEGLLAVPASPGD